MRKIIASILFLGICTGVFAQAVPFLNIPSDARTAAMGSTGIALEKGAFTIDDNMATSAITNRKAAFGANFWSWAPSTSALKLINAGGYYHFGKIAVALGGRYCMEKPYDIISAVGKPLGTYTPSSFTLGAGFAYRIIDPLAVGVTVRYVSANYYENTKGGTVAADINATFSKGGLRAAVGVANLGGKIKNNPLPALAKAGAAYHIGGFQRRSRLSLQRGLNGRYRGRIRLQGYCIYPGRFPLRRRPKSHPYLCFRRFGCPILGRPAGCHLDHGFVRPGKFLRIQFELQFLS